MAAEHFDVLIVGAGLSGIGAAYHLRRDCPGKTYAILEGRAAIGGTWDLFRYPGIRSDSDMYTLGYAFKPWREAKAIADGPSILNYVRETARDNDIERHIRFQHLVKHAAWSSADARWTVEATTADGSTATLTCNFLLMASGYYRYSAGYTPDFPGMERYQALAGGLGLHRQNGGRHRLRRHRRNHRPGDGQDCSQGHHAAALADLYGVSPGGGCVRQLAARPPARHAGL